MNETIETLAVNSWKSARVTESWRGISWQFLGIYRLAYLQGDEDTAELADFLSSLASYRSRGES